MNRRAVLAAGAAVVLLSGCFGSWGVSYSEAPETTVSRNWKLARVFIDIPEDLSVSESNSYAPDADIVWHGEERGDRRKQVGAILKQGLTRGSNGLNGDVPIVLAARLVQFHAVTPAAVSRAPGAVHNIKYDLQVFDARTGRPLTEPQRIAADLEANVGAAAVVAAVQGQTQKKRIVNHLAAVTAGWLGLGPDQRRTFEGFGR